MASVLSGFFKDVVYDMLKTAAKNAICTGLDVSAGVTDSLYAAYEDFLGVDVPSINIPGVVRGLVCDKPASRPKNPGQLGLVVPCVCDRYEITYRLRLQDGSDLGTGKVTVFGEIAGFDLIPLGTGFSGARVFCRGIVPGGGCRNQLEWVIMPGGTSAGTVQNLEVLSIKNTTRPDNSCGVPPTPTPNPVPPGGIELPDFDVIYAPTFGNNSQTTVNIKPTYLKPYFDIDNQLQLVVNLNTDLALEFGTLNVDARVNVATGDVTINLPGLQGRESPGGGSGKPALPGTGGGRQPVILDPVPPPGADVPIEGENPRTSMRLKGVLVSTQNAPIIRRLTRITQLSNPAIYAPSLGHVNFLYQLSADGAVTAWSEDFRVKNEYQFIPVPDNITAVDFGATPQPGIEWTVVPVYDRVSSQ